MAKDADLYFPDMKSYNYVNEVGSFWKSATEVNIEEDVKDY